MIGRGLELDGAAGAVVVEYNSAAYLAARHGVLGELVSVLAGVEGLVRQVPVEVGGSLGSGAEAR